MRFGFCLAGSCSDVSGVQDFTLLPPKNMRLLTNKSLKLSNLSTGCVINLNKL